jgi:hypothetical protein
VIALPTSIDDGVADGGGTAISAALASCAPGSPCHTTWLRRGLRILATIAFHRGYKRSMERTGDGLPLGLFFELGDMNTRASLYLL